LDEIEIKYIELSDDEEWNIEKVTP